MKMKIKLTDTDDGMVMCWCDDREAALFDQSIRGTHWEGPSDIQGAYAVIMNEPDLVAKLEKDGYEVDDSEYSPMGVADVA